ncbi:MAG: hypothetical protein ACR2PT_04820 [Endozoicomonas sp.]
MMLGDNPESCPDNLAAFSMSSTEGLCPSIFRGKDIATTMAYDKNKPRDPDEMLRELREQRRKDTLVYSILGAIFGLAVAFILFVL